MGCAFTSHPPETTRENCRVGIALSRVYPTSPSRRAGGPTLERDVVSRFIIPFGFDDDLLAGHLVVVLRGLRVEFLGDVARRLERPSVPRIPAAVFRRRRHLEHERER